MLFGRLRFFCVASIQNALHVVDMDDVADVIAHDLLAWHGVALEDMVEAHEDELEYDDDGAYWPDDGIRHFMIVWFDPHEHHEAREHWPGFFDAFTKWLPAGEPALAMELVWVSGREYENALRLHRR